LLIVHLTGVENQFRVTMTLQFLDPANS